MTKEPWELNLNSSEEEIIDACKAKLNMAGQTSEARELGIKYSTSLLSLKQQQKLLQDQSIGNGRMVFWTKILALSTIALAFVTICLALITYESSQRQIALDLTPSLEANYDAGNAVINVTNLGRGNLYLWGSKFGNESSSIWTFGELMGIGATYHIPVDNAEMVVAINSSLKNATSSFIFFDLYLKNEDGQKFISREALSVFLHNGKPEIDSQTRSIDQMDW